MARLTKRHNGVDTYIGPGCKYPDTGEIQIEMEISGVRTVLQRLAEYEETGLTPKEVVALQASNVALKKEALPLLEEKIKGRLVILPCRVGDTVFAAETSPVIPLSVMCVGVYLEGADGGDWESLENFGKTVFLTRDAAEVARKEQGG